MSVQRPASNSDARKRQEEKAARCSRCDEVLGEVVTEGGRATIRLSTSSHGDTLPITCPGSAAS